MLLRTGCVLSLCVLFIAFMICIVYTTVILGPVYLIAVLGVFFVCFLIISSLVFCTRAQGQRAMVPRCRH